MSKDKFFFLAIGAAIGVGMATLGGGLLFTFLKAEDIALPFFLSSGTKIVEEFDKALTAQSGKSFGKNNQLTFELFRGGTFFINGKSDFAIQRSNHYGDSAIIRSTKPLPKTYKITAVVGDIDYDLENIAGLSNDPSYPEGPQNENGCYLLSITDEVPSGHHTNIWWHQHRKVVIDVDNNVWGHGMPHPIFMVYFDKENKLNAYDGDTDAWQSEWKKAVTYEPRNWYKVQIEKTGREFIMRIMTEEGRLLKEGRVDLENIWNESTHQEDYFVLGDPHENYYQGSFKIKSITIE